MEKLIDRVLQELDIDKAMEHVSWLTYQTPRRQSGLGQDRKAAEYIVDQLKSYGCEAEILDFETYNSRVGESEFKLLSPFEKDYKSLPCCHIEPTPEGGAEYEVVYLGAGGEEDYLGKNVAGKAVLVEVSYAPATPEKARIAAAHKAAAMIFMNWGADYQDFICMRGLKAVWGNPTPESYDQIPKVTGCSITRMAGLELKELCLKGEKVKVFMRVTAERLWEKLPQPVGYLRGSEEPEKFLLVTAHLEAWHPGATDNATGDATQLELARVFAQHRDELKRSIMFAFWNGHEIAEASGSCWFSDTYWDRLSEDCIGYINIDSTGMIDTTQYRVDSSRELKDYTKKAVKYAIGEEVDPNPLGKIADQSFFGLGIPSVFGKMGFSDELLEETHGATFGWWNHTTEDGMDKVDPETLSKDNCVTAVVVEGLINADILPYDFTETAKDVHTKLVDLAPYFDGIFDVSMLLNKAERLEENVKKLNDFISEIDVKNTSAKVLDKVNDVLIKLSRNLTGACYTACNRYEQDSYGLTVLSKPLPLLYPIVKVSAMDRDSLEFKLMSTRLIRNRNMVTDALRNANEVIENLLDVCKL